MSESESLSARYNFSPTKTRTCNVSSPLMLRILDVRPPYRSCRWRCHHSCRRYWGPISSKVCQRKWRSTKTGISTLKLYNSWAGDIAYANYMDVPLHACFGSFACELCLFLCFRPPGTVVHRPWYIFWATPSAIGPEHCVCPPSSASTVLGMIQALADYANNESMSCLIN